MVRTHVLDVDHVVKQYTRVRAVDGISFHVDRGEVFALLGPNGAGKTTIVRMLLGILQPDSGAIRWDLGAESSLDPRRVGYLPEERGLHRDVPILRCLTYFGTLRGMDRKQARRAALAWLAKLELAERAGDKIESLSKGNQQKVQFAAAVLHEPEFVVLDEPFSGFDPINQERFLEHVVEMREKGSTILLSAHQMALVERICDRILLLGRGRSVLTGTLAEVREQFGTQRRLLLEVERAPDLAQLAEIPGVRAAAWVENDRLQVELEGDGPMNEVLRALSEQVGILGIQDQEPSLHDIYVQATQRSEAQL